MNFQKDYSLKNLNTFKVEAKADIFLSLVSKKDFIPLFKSQEIKENKLYFLGKGSNVLLRDNIQGLVIRNEIDGIRVLRETEDYADIEADSGADWCGFVEWCLANGYYGLENLAMIPGSLGAAPVQNIGAYGAEQCDYFHLAEVFDFNSGRFQTFSKNECSFGYRYSTFKFPENANLFITSVTYRLPKKFIPNLKYKELRNYFADIPDSELNLLSAKSIFDAVCEIRTRKLPNTEQEPNAGSFFKNPVINSAQLDNLKSLIPEPIYFPMDGNLFKVPAAFLIEKAGWKGYSGEFAGISEKHALIIINKGNATGKDILKLAEMIIQSIFDKFLIVLEPEVIFW